MLSWGRSCRRRSRRRCSARGRRCALRDLAIDDLARSFWFGRSTFIGGFAPRSAPPDIVGSRFVSGAQERILREMLPVTVDDLEAVLADL